MRLLGRHAEARIGTADALVQQAIGRLTGHDGGAIGAGRQRRIFAIEPQIRLPRCAVGAMALEAIVGQYGTDLALKIDGGGGLCEEYGRCEKRYGREPAAVIHEAPLPKNNPL